MMFFMMINKSEKSILEVDEVPLEPKPNPKVEFLAEFIKQIDVSALNQVN